MAEKYTKDKKTGKKRRRAGNYSPTPINGNPTSKMPDPEMIDNKIRCRRCGRTLAEKNFMRRNGKIFDMCKDCLYNGCDNMRPESFKWVLERYNIPFVRDKWIEQAARAYFKDPKKFSSKSVIGIYIRTMGMKQYVNYGFEDSEQLTKWYQTEYSNPHLSGQPLFSQITMTDLECASDSDGRRMIDTVQSVEPIELPDTMPVPSRKTKDQVNNFENRIKEENQMVVNRQKAHDEMESRFDWGRDLHEEIAYSQKKVEEEKPIPAEPAPQEPTTDSTFGEPPPLQSSGYAANIAQYRVNTSQDPNEQKIKDQLEDEDIALLAGRWGNSYLPSEWLQLEEMYERYEQEYELTADRAEVLKKMCKVSLRMDQALENAETTEYKQLSSVYDQLRKSAKFTDAQKEEKKDTYLDSIGQLVAVLEKEGGPIPAFDYKIETTQDIVDYTLRDMEKYTYSLVKNELGLGELIERYIAQLEQSEQTQRELSKAAELGGIGDIEASINDAFGEDIPDSELTVEDLVEREIEDMDEWG